MGIKLNLKGCTDKTFLKAVATIAAHASDYFVAKYLTFDQFANTINGFASKYPKGNPEANRVIRDAMELYMFGGCMVDEMVFRIYDALVFYTIKQ